MQGRGLICSTPVVCATVSTDRGEKHLFSGQNQATFPSSVRPLGECRMKNFLINFSKTFVTKEEVLNEDKIYEFVYSEIEQGKMDKAAQARAIEEGGANQDAVRQSYIKHRVRRVRNELIQIKENEEIKRQSELIKAKADEKLKQAIREKEKELERQRLAEAKRAEWFPKLNFVSMVLSFIIICIIIFFIIDILQM